MLNVKAKCFICDEEFIRKKFLTKHLNLHSKAQMIKILSTYQTVEGSGFP